MKTMLLIACTFAASANFAQPSIQWQKTIGGQQLDELTSVAQKTNGEYQVMGTSSSKKSYDKTQWGRGGSDYWAVFLNATGGITGQRTIGGSFTDYSRVIVPTNDNGALLCGSSFSNISGDKTANNKGALDYWIVKLNSGAYTSWDKTIGGSLHDQLHDAIKTADGGYMLAGYSSSDASYDKSEDTKGDTYLTYDYWIVKLNAKGEKKWDKTIGGNSIDILYSIQQTADRGYILGGVSLSNTSFDKSQDCRGFYDYWVVKIGPAGNVQWDKTYGGDNQEWFERIVPTSDGGYIMGGWTLSGISGDKTEASRGLNDYWIIKIDATGNIQWQRTLGGDNEDELCDIIQCNDGGYLVAGTSYSGITGDKIEVSRGKNDYWIVKLAPDGHPQWQKTIGGSMNDNLADILQTQDGGYLIGGSSESNISGEKTENRRGGNENQGTTYDYWIVKLAPETALNAITNNQMNVPPGGSLGFTVHPNPAHDVVFIETGGNASISVLSTQGELLLTRKIEKQGKINIASLPNGMYYIRNDATGKKQVVFKE